jgi:hypothetical protein
VKKPKPKKPRPPRRQFVEAPRPPLDAIEVVLKPNEYGWPEMFVPPLTGNEFGIYPTDLSDPYQEMMAWLEAIVDGADMARWVIFEEPSISQFIFVRNRPGLFGAISAHLLYLRSSEKGDYPAATACAVTPIGVVGSFYRSFRSFVESDAYAPMPCSYYPDDPEDDPEDHPPVIDLRQMRSLAVEAALSRSEPIQLAFQVTFRPGRP